MLKQRIITAIFLVPLAIAGLFYIPLLGFSIFIAIILTIAAWEWANLAGYEGPQRYFYALVVAALIAASSWVSAPVLLSAACIWWCLALVLVVRYPSLSSRWSSQIYVSLIGLVCLVPGYTALLTLKQQSNADFLILLLLLLIWGADIGAYFIGRAFGDKKLMPNVSPGKSWAGFYGGLISACLIATGMMTWFSETPLLSVTGGMILLGCALVVIVSVLGDLTESMFKRNRGIKDSSNLLPGHGGILDRIDSLLSAGPVYALLVLGLDWLI
ncbi:MAG: phosphatidate cytidylyltransferase [Pseudomonadales bacterium]|nr:phosphatidate cytidylyltransferase [Pseudomonadales bacterium]